MFFRRFMILGLFLSSFSVQSATYVVTNSGDTVTGGTLRWALQAANTNAGTDHITFNLPASTTITPATVLPSLSDLYGSVTIDGTTQPGYAGAPLIKLVGESAGSSYGLFINTPSNVVKGLMITRFKQSGIAILAAYNTIQGSYVISNAEYGIEVSGAHHNWVGGTNAAERNVISGNWKDGVYISGASAYGNTVIGNYIGTDPSGLLRVSNRLSGVVVMAPSNCIGSSVTGGGNVISGNGDYGILISTTEGHHNIVEGNYCGVSADGHTAMPNVSGIHLFNASSNTIGGSVPGSGNVLSGNINMGIDFEFECFGNKIAGNFIGTDALGTLDVGNALYGVSVESDCSGNQIGGDDSHGRNVISGNNLYGVYLHACTGNVIRGNFIGLSTNGTDVGNTSSGIYLWRSSQVVIGGTNAAAGNFIAGNEKGIHLDSCSNVTVRFNTIGLSADNLAVSNDQQGILVEAGAGHVIRDNVISGNGTHGLQMNGASRCILQGNKIGTDSTATAARGNKSCGVYIHNGSTNTLVGGRWADEGNVISGNYRGGIQIKDATTKNTILRGNRIGTDLAGLNAIPNQSYGVSLEQSPQNTIGSATNSQEKNVISGNAGQGIEMMFSNSCANVVVGNYIGTDISGTNGLPNVGAGIYISQSSTNQIGGVGTGAVNRIAYNVGGGIQVESGVANLLVNNSIYRNGVLGIDLGLGTPTLNDEQDPDFGPNRYQNFPVLISASNDGTNIRIEWTLDSVPSEPFMIEFYGSTGPNPLTYGEGEYVLGRFGPFTNPASDILRGTNLVTTPQPPPNIITALATHNTLMDTSEFSRRMLLDSDNDGMGDGYEAVHFGGYTNGQPNADTDGDTFSNLAEFIADTDPKNSLSCLQIKNLNAAPPQLGFTATCSRERNYQVQISTNMNTWAYYNCTFVYDGADGRFTVKAGTNAAHFRLHAAYP